MTANFYKYTLKFKQASGTSRGVLTTKETYILEISDGKKKGIGECAVFRGLSYDDIDNYEKKMAWLCENINLNPEILKIELKYFPSIIFGLEQALLNYKYGDDLYFPSDFTKSKDFIKINGLIWMGTTDFMKSQINDKLKKGFDCIKLKIGIDWKSERKILGELRKSFPKETLELRVDANGAFGFEEAKIVLKELAELDIHSIEQPIKKSEVRSLKSEKISENNSTDCFVPHNDMAELCAFTPVPIALDEELIGVIDFEDKKKLLEEIKPQYIILKPALIGGFSGSDEWISIAENIGINWWITSALESNIGLNAICQYTYTKQNPLPQGLGTGALFTNNFDTRLALTDDRMWMK